MLAIVLMIICLFVSCWVNGLLMLKCNTFNSRLSARNCTICRFSWKPVFGEIIIIIFRNMCFQCSCATCQTCININKHMPKCSSLAVQLQHPWSEGLHMKWSISDSICTTDLKIFWNAINLNIKLQSRNCSASLFCQPTLWPEPPLPITIGLVLNHLLFSDCVCSPTSQVSPSLRSHSHTVCPSVAGGSPRLLDGHHYNICL